MWWCRCCPLFEDRLVGSAALPKVAAVRASWVEALVSLGAAALEKLGSEAQHAGHVLHASESSWAWVRGFG